MHLRLVDWHGLVIEHIGRSVLLRISWGNFSFYVWPEFDVIGFGVGGGSFHVFWCEFCWRN